MQQKYMTEAEKGYKCPDCDCFNCEFRKTKCIVYSKEGQKNYKKWLKNQQENVKKQKKDSFGCHKKLQNCLK